MSLLGDVSDRSDVRNYLNTKDMFLKITTVGRERFLVGV